MFEINMDVIYGMNGVCRIVDIRNETFGEEEKLYYVLNPISDLDATIYVPVNNPKSVSKMKTILTKDEVYELIHSMPQEPIIQEKNSKVRKEIFTQIIKEGDRRELIKLIKTVYVQKKQREKEGKKVWASDETALKKAERILYEEFAVVLELHYDEVIPLIHSELKGVMTTG